MRQILSTLLLSFTLFTAFSQDATLARTKHFNIEKGLAVDGYDMVTYFNIGKAVRGKKEFATINQGITFYFSSAATRDLFKTNPTKYEPQYGGWCAYAMGNDGTKVEIDPQTFKVLDGKLYLFYNKYFTNTLKSWNKDELKLKTSADAHWQKTNH